MRRAFRKDVGEESDVASDANGDVTSRNLPALSLHVPEPRFRPGDDVDFAAVEVPPAGAAQRPDTVAPAADFTDLAYTMIRVLDDDGRAVGPWDPRLTPDRLRRMLKVLALLAVRIAVDTRKASA